jgi:Ca-activated chloride channel family protein
MTRTLRPSRSRTLLHLLTACCPLAPVAIVVGVFASPTIARAGVAFSAERLRPIETDQVGSGELLWRSERGLVPLPIEGIEVELDVTGPMIRGRLTQRFLNPTSETIDVLYAFPLPEHAAVGAMELRVGSRTIVAEVREREEARRTFEQARAEGRRAALVAEQRPNLFTTAAANIGAGERIEVVLEYVEEADWSEGAFRLRFPLTFTPRAGADAGDSVDRCESTAATASPDVVPRARVHVSIAPGLALDEVRSPSHGLRVERREPGWRLDTGDEAIDADRDFRLEWRPARGRTTTSILLVEEHDGERYALLMLLPPAATPDAANGLPTETLFVVDISGSMAGPSIEQARAALHTALDRLRPGDAFNLMKFDDAQDVFRPDFVDVAPEALDAARAWVDDLATRGGTDIQAALMRAVSMTSGPSSGRSRRIVFVTDGAVENEQEVLRAVVERLGDVRLHTVAIGHAPNAWLLRKMAAAGHGLCAFVGTQDEARNDIARFLERIERPVLENVHIDLAGAVLDDVLPSVAPDLYAGEPLVVSARLGAGRGGEVARISGLTRHGVYDVALAIPAETPGAAGVAVRWGRARVERVMDGLLEGVDPSIVRAEVIGLGLAFHLVTPFTSLVAVDRDSVEEASERTSRVGSGLPQGGTDDPLRLRIGLGLLLAGAAVLTLLHRRPSLS